MAARYWVGGTATWDASPGTKWAATSGGAGGQSVPTIADDVYFNAASGTATVTNTASMVAKSIQCTGFTGTLAGTGNITVAGSVILSSGMTYSKTSATITFTAAGGLTTFGKTVGDIAINAPAVAVILGDALTLGILTLSAGTLSTTSSNYSITGSRIIISGSSAKALSLNGSTVSLSQEGFDAFDYTGSNLTFNAGTSTINVTSGSGGGNVSLDPGSGLTFNNVSFTSTSALSISIRGANTFNTLTFTAPASAGNLHVFFGGNQTITTLVASGASTVRRMTFRSTVFETASTLTVGTYATKQNIDFQDITAAGASAPWSGTSIGDCLGNSNITFTAAKTVYWNLSGTQAWTATAWATTAGGSPAAANFPLAQDTVVFTDTGAAGTITISSNTHVGTFNASARTSAFTLTINADVNFYGNFTNGTGDTGTGSKSPVFRGRTTQTIISAGKQFTTVQAAGGATSLNIADNLTCTGSLLLSGGSDINANTYTVSVSSFTATSASTINLGSASWTVTAAGSCWNTTGSTVSGSAEIVLSNNTTTARTFAAGSNTFGKLTIGGNTSTSTTTITGTAFFSEIASTKTVAHTIVFPNVTTTVGAFTVRGASGNLVTLSRTGASGTFTLTKSTTGVVDVDYLSISNSTVNPSNIWYAGANSVDGGGNTRWNFTVPPTGAAGNFLSLF